MNVSISSASGFSNYLLNAADVKNRGFELDAKAVVFRESKDLWQFVLPLTTVTIRTRFLACTAQLV